MANCNTNGTLIGVRHVKKSRASLMAHFDAMPLYVKEYYWNNSVNTYPNSVPSPADLERFRLNALASIEKTWGPDHPAAQDARQRVTLRNGQAKPLLTVEDLF